MNRTDVGLREFDRASGGRGPAATGRVRAVSPALAEGVEEFIFADVFARPALTARERELVTVAVLCALGGAEPQLGLHIPAALECGVDPDELVAMCEQLAPYAGFPRALNALRAVRAAIEERGLPLPLPSERVTLGDHRTLVTEMGEGGGPTLVLVHAPGLDRLLWRDLLRLLAPTRLLLAYDVRGHGGAGGIDAPDSAVLVDDLVRLVDDRLPADQPVEVVTAGAAAGLGARAAASLGTRVVALTHIAPTASAPAPAEPQVLAHWLQAGTLAADGASVRYLRDRVWRCHPPAWAVWPGWHSDAPQPQIPTRVVAGEHDPDLPAVTRLAAVLGARLQEVAGAGQLVPIDAPEALAAVFATP